MREMGDEFEERERCEEREEMRDVDGDKFERASEIREEDSEREVREVEERNRIPPPPGETGETSRQRGFPPDLSRQY